MLRHSGKAALAALAAASMLAASATPAEARGREYRRDHTGAIIGAGIVGLAVGAAIASSDRPVYRERGYYYDGDDYYRPAPPRYYYPAYPAPGYYGYYRDDWRWHHRPHREIHYRWRR